MGELKKKYLSLVNLLTSSFSQKLVIILLLGVILIGFGVLSYKINIFSGGDNIEVLNKTTDVDSTSSNDVREIIVEISGAVLKPGVYKLNLGDRIDNLLIVSGGLSQDADREWVSKKINRASKLIDGQKIYIYHIGESSAKESDGIKVDQGVLGDSNSTLISINTSSQSELEKLNGIGPVFAQNIIEHRPYSIKEELVTKGAISQKTFEKIKDDIEL